MFYNVLHICHWMCCYVLLQSCSIQLWQETSDKLRCTSPKCCEACKPGGFISALGIVFGKRRIFKPFWVFERLLSWFYENLTNILCIIIIYIILYSMISLCCFLVGKWEVRYGPTCIFLASSFLSIKQLRLPSWVTVSSNTNQRNFGKLIHGSFSCKCLDFLCVQFGCIDVYCYFWFQFRWVENSTL